MLPGVGLLDAAWLAIAVVFAVLTGLSLVRPLLVSLASNVPLIGGSLAGGIESVLGGWQNGLQATFRGGIGIVVSLVDWLGTEAGRASRAVQGFVGAVGAGFVRLEFVVIPAAVQAALASVGALVGNAVAPLAAQIAQLRADAQAGFAALVDWVGARIRDAEALAAAEAAVATAQAETLFAQAEADLRFGLAVEQALIDASASLAASLAGAALAQAVTYTDQLAALIGAELAALRAQELAALRALAIDLGQAAAQGDADLTRQLDLLRASLQASFDALLNGNEFAFLGRLLGDAEQIAANDAASLAGAALRMARGQIASVAVIRARVAPVLDAIRADLAGPGSGGGA